MLGVEIEDIRNNCRNSLNLNYFQLTSDDFFSLCSALCVTTSLTDLDLYDYPLSSLSAAKNLAKGLSKNGSLRRINFSRVQFRAAEAKGSDNKSSFEWIVEGLSYHSCINFIDLSFCGLGPNELNSLKQLFHISSLLHLNLHWNMLGARGVLEILECLSQKTPITSTSGLLSLDLGCNDLTDKIYSRTTLNKLWTLLEKNHTLTSLDLSGGAVDLETLNQIQTKIIQRNRKKQGLPISFQRKETKRNIDNTSSAGILSSRILKLPSFLSIERKILDSIDEKEIIACLEGVDIVPTSNKNNTRHVIPNNDEGIDKKISTEVEIKISALPIDMNSNEEAKHLEIQFEEYQNFYVEEFKTDEKTNPPDIIPNNSNRLSSQSLSKRIRRTSDAQLEGREYHPLCKICFTKDLDAVLYNCGHRFCLDCCIRMFKDRKRCPSCNRPILDAIRTYDQ